MGGGRIYDLQTYIQGCILKGGWQNEYECAFYNYSSWKSKYQRIYEFKTKTCMFKWFEYLLCINDGGITISIIIFIFRLQNGKARTSQRRKHPTTPYFELSPQVRHNFDYSKVKSSTH